MNPNVTLVSGAIAILTLVVSIFGASWLNQRATERLVDQLDKRFEEGLAGIEKGFGERLAGIEKSFGQRLAGIEQRLDRIERQLEAIFKPMLPPRS